MQKDYMIFNTLINFRFLGAMFLINLVSFNN